MQPNRSLYFDIIIHSSKSQVLVRDHRIRCCRILFRISIMSCMQQQWINQVRHRHPLVPFILTTRRVCVNRFYSVECLSSYSGRPVAQTPQGTTNIYRCPTYTTTTIPCSSTSIPYNQMVQVCNANRKSQAHWKLYLSTKLLSLFSIFCKEYLNVDN